jgi:hypothetical protein
MTPKEKAEKLFQEYLLETGNKTFAIKCAIIAVNEIIDVCDLYINYHHVYAYYLEVKQELENYDT